MPNIDKDCTKVYEPEFNLSNEIYEEARCGCSMIHTTKVKEFIKILKLTLNEKNKKETDRYGRITTADIYLEIDKLAGKDLL